MKTRRELLILSGTSAAAVVVPSFFPNARSIALAKGDKDPMLAEIASQFQRAVMGLGSNPPKGNAHQLAAMYRMASAWARSNNLDARVRERLDAALASEGHHALVTRLASVDGVAEAKRRGLPIPPTMRNPDTTAIAKAIGMHKGGFTYELAWRLAAQRMEKKAARFDRMMAIANGRRPSDMVIRRVQEPLECEEFGENANCPTNVTGDCTQNPDGSFSCNLVATAPSRTAPNGLPPADEETCKFINFYEGMQQASWALLVYFALPELLWMGILMGLAWDWYEWYIGC